MFTAFIDKMLILREQKVSFYPAHVCILVRGLTHVIKYDVIGYVFCLEEPSILLPVELPIRLN